MSPSFSAEAGHLDRLGLTALSVAPDPLRIATEGALWGSVQLHKLLREAVVLSDDAGQFNTGQHALCWVRAGRLVHKLDAFTDKHRAAQTRVRGLVRGFHASARGSTASSSAAPASSRWTPAGAAACQQGRVADGARPAGDPVPHQRFRERYSLLRHTAQGQRRDNSTWYSPVL